MDNQANQSGEKPPGFLHFPRALAVGTRLDFQQRRRRRWLDKVAASLIAVGGVGVIGTVLLILFYLVFEVTPLFRSAQVELMTDVDNVPVLSSQSRLLGIDEQSQLGIRLQDNGNLVLFEIESGAERQRFNLELTAGQRVTSAAIAASDNMQIAVGTSNGQVLLLELSLSTAFDPLTLERSIVPTLQQLGPGLLQVFSNQPVASLDIRVTEGLYRIAVSNEQGVIRLFQVDDHVAGTMQLPVVTTLESGLDLFAVYLEGNDRLLYAVSNSGLLRVYSLAELAVSNSEPVMEERLVTEGVRITAIEWLSEKLSMMVGDSAGNIGQWLAVGGDDNLQVRQVRSLNIDSSAVRSIAPERSRKVYAVATEGGTLAIVSATSNSRRYSRQETAGVIGALAMSPRGDLLLAVDSVGTYHAWQIDNPHPEVSLASLWGEVWYESYPAPDYVWQSSSASETYEPKFSLAPLSFGTLKAAFYAMLLATPLAVCSAIFTGYFMAPAMRRQVKPLIELMEAMPTVVLGFLAGLWLAPFIETNLMVVVCLITLLPISFLILGYASHRMSLRSGLAISGGWEVAVLLPALVVVCWLILALSPALEQWLFGGDMSAWVSSGLGIDYDQRNALVVGFAMGFAVIPTIFSIAEDAIFTVPRHLSDGSLALGATPWQTLYSVVLPTASPGIFSGIMIGMGRAVGETMIVLMATGNTPLMDANIFEGMRTLAANIAVEIPEPEVGSSHYRVLFLSALVLFLFTFILNTIAELVRQRLRTKYSSI